MIMYKAVRSQMSTEEFINFVSDNGKQTYQLDLSFQSTTRWEKAQQQYFLRSHMHGMNLSSFLYCDTKSCLNNLEEFGVEAGDTNYDYFSKWSGCLLNIDSNNRTQTLLVAYNNLVPFPKGEYYTTSGHPIKLSKDTFFKDLPESLRVVFLQSEITVTTVVSATYEQLKICFLAVNYSEPLNNHEIRQASLAPIADEVRSATTKYLKPLLCIFPEKEHKRRYTDEMIAQLYVLGSIGVDGGLDKKVLNHAYGHLCSAPNPNVQFKMKRVRVDFLPTLFDMVKLLPLSKTGKINNGKSLVINLAMILAEIKGIYTKEKLFDITDREKFVKHFLRIESALRESNKKVIDKKDISKTFKRICQSNTGENLRVRKEELMMAILQDKKMGEVLCERLVQDADATLPASVRVQLWFAQGEHCVETNKRILFSDIMNTDKWQVDHIIPKSRGGTNDISNLRLIDAHTNMSMGNKTRPMKQLEAA